MKTIGLLGGMSWESTVPYYRIVNEAVKEKLGGFHSAKVVLYSVDFHDIEACQASGDWDMSGEILANAAAAIQRAGAEFLVLCTNTMHKVAHIIEAKLTIPLLHIADLTADRLSQQGVTTVGLLGTKYTMEQEFYKQRLVDRGFEVLVPDEGGRTLVNDVIYGELCLGTIDAGSKREFLRIVDELAARGAQGIILGCTEIGMLIGQADTGVPLFDTTLIHAQEAARYALEE